MLCVYVSMCFNFLRVWLNFLVLIFIYILCLGLDYKLWFCSRWWLSLCCHSSHTTAEHGVPSRSTSLIRFHPFSCSNSTASNNNKHTEEDPGKPKPKNKQAAGLHVRGNHPTSCPDYWHFSWWEECCSKNDSEAWCSCNQKQPQPLQQQQQTHNWRQ